MTCSEIINIQNLYLTNILDNHVNNKEYIYLSLRAVILNFVGNFIEILYYQVLHIAVTNSKIL